MNTPTHAALNFLLLARRPGSPRALIVFAAVLPDLPIYLFFLLETFVFGEPQARIWREIYFQTRWQTLFDAFHSLPVFVALQIWFWRRRNRRGQLFAVSLALHSLVDWPTHLEDAHAYLWPLWRRPLPGLVSYWHHGSPIWMLELSIMVAALGWLAWEKLSRRPGLRPSRELCTPSESR